MRVALTLLCLFLWQQTLLGQAIAQPADKPLYVPSLISTGENALAGITLASQPGFPFTATVEVENHTVSPTGEPIVQRLQGKVARDSAGSLRTVVDLNFLGEPPIPSNVTIHIYDVRRRADITLFPSAGIAILSLEDNDTPLELAAAPTKLSFAQTPILPPHPRMRTHGTALQSDNDSVKITREDLGIEHIDGQPLRHGRETTTVPAYLTLAKKPLITVSDYWYAQDLQAFVLIQRHSSGQNVQTITLRDIRRENPPASLFRIRSATTSRSLIQNIFPGAIAQCHKFDCLNSIN